MVSYKAPVEDIRFILNDVLNIQSLSKLPEYQDFTPDLINAVLDESAKFVENECFPINHHGDIEGCQFDQGHVKTPNGFKQAYDKMVEAGWSGLSCSPQYGGQGLPKLLGFVFEEMGASANLSFIIYPGLTLGAYNALERFADDEIKNLYLPKLASGQWSGTMCLTEPHCGTDLGLIKTKAVPNADGSYALTGTKIFISGGEQDLTENIIHLVLARLPGAPAGTKGISMFLVPKFQVNPDGSLGERNKVVCGSIEHKMGIKGSSTALLNFDGATGYLVGKPHKGLKAMFVMMNGARLVVGLQGLGMAEVAYQNAVEYAKNRLQGRSVKGPQALDKPADPIIVHPDIRHMLLTVKSINEAGRALSYWAGMHMDILKYHPDPITKQDADDLLALMTPVIKAFLTDHGFDATNKCLQVFGGHGYIAETGMEQYVRDSRVLQIYEGANGIQALDLVGRKMVVGKGRMLRQFFHAVDRFLNQQNQDAATQEMLAPFVKSFNKLQQATLHIAQKGLNNPEEAVGVASDYLRMFGLVALGFMWIWMASVAMKKLQAGAENEMFYKTKLKTARFYLTKVLPQTQAHFLSIMGGAAVMMDFDVSEF